MSLRLGLLDNGKPNARALLERTAAAMAARTSIQEHVVVAKAHAAGPGDADLLAKLAASFDVVLTGSGD